MCVACNPFCGMCKAPKLVAVLCNKCGKSSLYTRDETLIALGLEEFASQEAREGGGYDQVVLRACDGCGTELRPSVIATVKPKQCRFSGITCGFPCGRHRRLPKQGEPECCTRVPLSEGFGLAAQGEPCEQAV